MDLFKSWKFYIYTAIAAGVTGWASHHPLWHDPAIWLLGVLGHAIGTEHAKTAE